MFERLSQSFWAWLVAGALMITGVVWFSVALSTTSLWFGSLLAGPFVALLTGRARRKGFDMSSSDPPDGSGPFTGP
jgi:hypothetical protein